MTVDKTFKRRPGRLLNVKLNLYPIFRKIDLSANEFFINFLKRSGWEIFRTETDSDYSTE